MSILSRVREISRQTEGQKEEEPSEQPTGEPLREPLYNKIVEEVISDVNKSEEDMCYRTSKMVYERLRGEQIEETSIDQISQFGSMLIPNSADDVDLIFNIEITISCGPYTEQEKQNIIAKNRIKRRGIFNFIFAKEDLRIFMHAFNITIQKNNIIVSQSWFKCQKYSKIIVYDNFQNYKDIFITKILISIFSYYKDPSSLYLLFNKQITEDDQKIFRMIKGLQKPFKYQFKVAIAKLSSDLNRIKNETESESVGATGIKTMSGTEDKMTEEMKKEILYTEVQNRTLKEKGITYNYKVITDSYLKGGAKTRGLQFFFDLKNEGYKEVSFPAFSDGYGQVAVAYASMLVGMKATIFINKKMVDKEYKRAAETDKAIEFGANVIELSNPDGSYVKSAILEQKAKEYATNGQNIRYLNFGLYEEGYIKRFSETLSEVRKIYHLNPSEIWTASGTGTLANAISRAFPGVPINIVQTGFKIWSENIESIKKTSGNKLQLYQFKSGTRTEKPPYKCHGAIDYKIWYFASRHMRNGALIWNVA